MPVIFMPTSPALVPELGQGDAASSELRNLVRSLIDDTLARYQVTSISLIGSRSTKTYTSLSGSFAAWGAPQVSVGEGNYLSEMVMRSVVGSRELSITVSEDLDQDNALIIYGLDGPAGLDTKAPLSLIPGSRSRHQWCQAVLAGQEVSWPADVVDLLEDGIVEPEPWWKLRHCCPRGARLVAQSDAYGVGRYVAFWEGLSQ